MACNKKLSPDRTWANTRWVLIEMKGVPVQLSNTRRDAYISFNADEKRFNGNGGCNQVSGNYSIDKNKIDFTEVISTKMSCDDIGFEQVFLATLDKVNRFEEKDIRLMLKNDKDVILMFERR